MVAIRKTVHNSAMMKLPAMKVVIRLPCPAKCIPNVKTRANKAPRTRILILLTVCLILSFQIVALGGIDNRIMQGVRNDVNSPIIKRKHNEEERARSCEFDVNDLVSHTLYYRLANEPSVQRLPTSFFNNLG
jgi:hypothetical protein